MVVRCTTFRCCTCTRSPSPRSSKRVAIASPAMLSRRTTECLPPYSDAARRGGVTIGRGGVFAISMLRSPSRPSPSAAPPGTSWASAAAALAAPAAPGRSRLSTETRLRMVTAISGESISTSPHTSDSAMRLPLTCMSARIGNPASRSHSSSSAPGALSSGGAVSSSTSPSPSAPPPSPSSSSTVAATARNSESSTSRSRASNRSRLSWAIRLSLCLRGCDEHTVCVRWKRWGGVPSAAAAAPSGRSIGCDPCRVVAASIPPPL
mmetsp:Transcript_30860/g.80745  ORF Transcript_30860/g.80745 Transcript_30860/m.80745 type:complete len:264 (-) Transcript_30860:225-1016(-)